MKTPRLLAFCLAASCSSEPTTPPSPSAEGDDVPRSMVPLPVVDERRVATRTTTLAPSMLMSAEAAPSTTIARKRVTVTASGVSASLRDAGISDAVITALDVATVRRFDLQSQIEQGALIDLYLRGDALVGFHADTIVGPIWAARYDGSVSSRGWYDDAGRSLNGALRSRPLDLVRVTSGYGSRFHPIRGTETRHTGVDYGAAIGTSVASVGDGIVREAGFSSSAGKYLKVAHADGWESWYLHLNDIIVKKGEAVKQGQTIAYSGNTGASTGPHLHFELRIANIPIDPRRTVPVPTMALSPRELPQHAALLTSMKETR